MNKVKTEKIKALKLKAEVQNNLARRLKSIPNSISYSERIRKVVNSGKLGKWWKSLPKVSS